MNFISRYAIGHRGNSSPWNDLAPIREELFGVERLEFHAESLAAAQAVTTTPVPVMSLHKRLNNNAEVLLAAYHASAAELESGRGVVHAAEWLLDNYHIVEEQIREIRDDLPPGYYRQLPKLASGPFAGYPRVFGLAWAFVAHTDSHFDPDTLRRFIQAYQRIQPLTIGELWAVAITLRIVLIENLRRLAEQISVGRSARADAEELAEKLLQPDHARATLDKEISSRSSAGLSDTFIVHLVKRLRDQDPRSMPAMGWLEEMARRQGLSIDGVVQKTQQREGASNVSVRNVITSMRLISDIDWAALFESVSLIDECLARDGHFSAMDFPTRNLYRSAIEQLARGSLLSELEIVEVTLGLCSHPQDVAQDVTDAERACDPGYYLIAEGRLMLEQAIHFKPPARLLISRFNLRLGIAGYIGTIIMTTMVLLAVGLQLLGMLDMGSMTSLAIALLGFIPASEAATSLVNRFIVWNFSAMPLPGLALTSGIPSSCRTLIAMPILLTNEVDLLAHVERLEVHYLSGVGGDLYFALLSDGLDADQEEILSDTPLLALALAAIEQLNQKYSVDGGTILTTPRFLFLHRRRVFSASEGRWIGWERKRGKLHELNRLLRGATDTTFMSTGGISSEVPDGVRYVITLDADTKLPRDTVAKLIGKMAHPLNQAIFDAAERRVVKGYAILQPRVTPSLPLDRDGSFYQRIFSAPGGMDPYAAASSDVYQDMFGEGSYTGKGIYDVDAFEASLAARVPENVMLSHDLFEGIFARAGLASDIEVVEDSPCRYDVAAKRQHRWARGDWQLLPWALGWGPAYVVPVIGRWKMLDNLRRSLVAPSFLTLLVACWFLPFALGIQAILFLLVILALPGYMPILLSVLPHRRDIHLRKHISNLGRDLGKAASHHFLTIALLVDQSWRMADAIIRTWIRLGITRRHLLEWTTAAQSTSSPSLTVMGFYREMAGSTVFAMGLCASAISFSHVSWPLVLPFAMLWGIAPFLAFCASYSPVVVNNDHIDDLTADALRLTARRTWRFFERFVTPEDNMLPPDNFQEAPNPIIAHRTSPTNMGLYLLSTVAARDFGWSGTIETLERLEATFVVMQQLRKHRGHFFNWYGTLDMSVLDPPYISSVDSGNLAGHLIALANACEEWVNVPHAANASVGILDHFTLAREALLASSVANDDSGKELFCRFEEIATHLHDTQVMTMLPALKRLTDKTAVVVQGLIPVSDHDNPPELVIWVNALAKSVAAHHDDQALLQPSSDAFNDRLQTMAANAREMALAMDFAFMIEPERKLLSIGYSLQDNHLDPSCYDLLASEARLASLFTIAKGDVSTKHWFRLGRTATPLGNGSALISWSGSMFEYLMPSLVMRAPVGSLLEQTNKLIVARQQSYGQSLEVPWGISESAYNARDIEFTYQYSNFGVPGLGLKRGLSDNLVIAPYATGLAAMIDPNGAQENFVHLASMGALGRYGFYEALDFTRARLREDQEVAIVRNYMAHHQGMTIVAIANSLHHGQMRSRFHREPMIQACELLLQERMPRDIAIAHPRAEEVSASMDESSDSAPAVRRFTTKPAGSPVTHLLSNGSYSVMLTATGAGYSRWRDIAVTRWQEDVTRETDGYCIFIKDIATDAIWTADGKDISTKPQHRMDSSEIIFSEDHAEFIRRGNSLVTHMDVLVSGEDDAEVRRVSLTNSSRRHYELELTSYIELVLATPANDRAHPAFSKMFVVTEYLPEFGALLATRRLRAPNDPQIWAAHFAVIEGEVTTAAQYESDRSRFIGRGNTLKSAAVISGGANLSNTVGTVLDPIFSLRNRLRIAPGKVAKLAFWTVMASSREELLDLIDKHHDRSAFDRARTLAWTQAQVQLRYLDVAPEAAADFQRLAAPVLYMDQRFRAHPDAMMRGAGSQSGLWPHSISGDLPIVLLRIDEIEDMPQVHELLRAHQYWRMKQLYVDLVIINDRASSYIQDLQVAIETAVRTFQARRRAGEKLAKGMVYTLRADLMSMEYRALLYSVARVSLLARRGLIAEQCARLLPQALPAKAPRLSRAEKIPVPHLLEVGDLEFFNGFGGFDQEGTEYVTVLNAGITTPAPWINVIANAHFGFQVSATGSGYTWADNSRENQLTPWSNDAVMDPSGEVFYVRDDITGEICSPTAQPLRDEGTYIARHGYGYSKFEHNAHELEFALLQYVPLNDPVKISRLVIRNLSGRARRLSVTAYTEWILGTSRGASAPFVMTEIDAVTGAMFAKNPWSIGYANRIAFADLNGKQTHWTADRTEFIGRGGDLSAPDALTANLTLSANVGAGMDPCAALQQSFYLEAGESIEVVSLLGQCESVEASRVLVARYRELDLDHVLKQVTDNWTSLLGSIQVKTPDRAMDIMLNGWLLYQTMACRVLARSAFYQASGAYGFRDQLQDCMALTFASPATCRTHLLRAAGRQFVQGDMQHWWQPQSGQGVRTRISDDCVWLAFATAHYIATTGDAAILEENVPFLDGAALHEGEHDSFFQPMLADEVSSLYEHCARGLALCLQRTGEHGLPLIGTGDWNDGMNRVGEAGQGESVWLGWLLIHTLRLFAPLALDRQTLVDQQRATAWTDSAEAVRQAIEQEAWDGEWYRRATFDDGTWLGSRHNTECQIDSIAQSWAVLSGAADTERSAVAMASLEQYLIDKHHGLALLFAPPFDQTQHDPGYIKGYPPGLRENGGQYSHAAMWTILAFAKLGHGTKAAELFSLLNPVNHARNPAEVERYKVEPYVIAADVYSVFPHKGRGGWTWYTGSAGWMYRAGIEGILGIRRSGNTLVIFPCMPAEWKLYEADIDVQATQYHIRVDNLSNTGSGITSATLNGAGLALINGGVEVPLNGGMHTLIITC
ncbi:protein ndvB [Methylobacillus gramineus]|uniref:GH36-type glycosyl hydrolase domain-containing protein n=1 Tax=Methylobacillus gramineus TaxID=755169 RepID=UPI001CFF6217|nr:glucoamylase family protein [Methylobacillus gramineus]MCB5184281.1 protein ndvB [Methylobacillus gramineus]